jgi:hypothetical protein
MQHGHSSTRRAAGSCHEQSGLAGMQGGLSRIAAVIAVSGVLVHSRKALREALMGGLREALGVPTYRGHL